MNIEKVKVMGILQGYRYISLVLTSLFYIIGTYDHSMKQRIMIMTGMFFTAFVMDYLYRQNRDSRQKVLVLVIIETLGNCLLIIPSGGLESPYVWYIVNTLFIAGLELGFGYLWGSVVLYLGNMGIASWYMNPTGAYILERLNIIGGFLLVSVAIQLLVSYAKALEEQGNKVEQYLQYAMSSYETVYIVTSQNNLSSWAKVILDYMTQTLGAKKALIVLYNQEEDKHYARGMTLAEEEHLLEKLSIGKKGQAYQEGKVCYQQGEFVGIPIKYAYEDFGILVIEGKKHTEALQFLGYISGMLLKKIELEAIHQELILNHEHNRIANEIHDSVLQQLFGVSCQAFTLANKLDKLEGDVVKQGLNSMRLQVTQAMTDLRSMIYGMSWQKEGVNTFLERLTCYLKRLEEQHEVVIDLEVQGDTQHLSIEEQKVFYRVCCEATSNGIRHGKAERVNIELQVSGTDTRLLIVDNGKGFDYEETIRTGQFGMGLHNMQQLIEGIGGQLCIQSCIGKGTRLEIILSQSKTSGMKEGVI